MSYTLFSGSGIGTHWQIDVENEDPFPENKKKIHNAVAALIEQYDSVLSRFRSDSLIAKMARTKGSYTVPSYFNDLFRWYKKLYDATDGIVTPLIGQVLADAGYDTSYSLKRKPVLTQPPSWHEVISMTQSEFTLKRPALLDVGAAGKGQLIDLVSVVLEEHGIRSYTIDAGGDILHKSPINKSIRVGLENPNDFSLIIGEVNLANKSICASAGSRRKWEGFHHVIHPFTLRSPTDIIATWVIADTAMHADGIATCLFFVPPEQLSALGSFEYLMLNSEMRIARSSGFEVVAY